MGSIAPDQADRSSVSIAADPLFHELSAVLELYLNIYIYVSFSISLQVNDLVKLVHIELETMTTIYFVRT